ncbi:Butenolide signaling repressing protein-like [Trema orientale]|uniref:Butenolide signaling repressing protein-like n=1 Tax=Trema orientale TaxID=63057 RepID=A0A2P5FI17_TREOI|nr:Butenolide signaling repressing protein-like [Trema orientale]
MRAGGCTLQQGLTAEAASVVKQAVTLARRRGHAQVTPLHVAHTMLAASTGLLRQACLQSQAQCHPLQCKALELCFNVALNRLPASNSSPMLGGHHHHHHSQNPSISNALIAAFKRAQAHQRRGSIENQQQPLLAVKIELEQLIISILDDPSVSRVMREAGFSSTLVKSNVEQAVSLEICSQTTPNNSVSSNINKSSSSKESNLLGLSHNQQSSSTMVNHINGSKPGKPDPIRAEDVASVIESLVSKKRRSIVVVGECLSSIEGVVRGVMEKVEKEDVPEGLREVKFIPFYLSSFGNSSRVEVEQKFVELRSLLRSCMAKGVILYLGDLKWATEYRASTSSTTSTDYQQGRGYYCPVEHMIMELGKLVCGIGENIGRFWLMGIATFQTYMRCKSGHPSLETIWGIHPLTVPAGSLRLSLVTDSELKSEESGRNNGTSKSLDIVESGDKQLSCCAECSAKFEAEARSLQSDQSTTSPKLPAWLQQCKNETKGLLTSNDQNCVQVTDLCRKWNSFCYSTHQQPNSNISDKTLITFSSSSSASGFNSYHDHQNQNPNVGSAHNRHESWPVVEVAKQPWRHQNYLWETQSTTPLNNKAITNSNEPSLRMFIPETPNQKQPFTSNPNSTPTSASSSDVVMETEYSQRFKELNAENLKTLCNALEKKVPWQKDIIPEIASTILKCRSGKVRRKGNNVNPEVKEETWLFFQGVDLDAKEKIAKELARLVFGSQNDFVSIALSSFSSSTRADSSEDCGRNLNKRSRDEQSCSYIERFGEAVSFNPHRVFLVEDVEQADYCSQMGFKRAIERGRVANSSGEEVDLRDAIVILCCESFSSRSRACSPPVKQKMESSDHQDQNDHDDHQVEESTIISPCVSLDLNISFDDDENEVAEDQTSIDDIGLLESVDRRIIFKIQEL